MNKILPALLITSLLATSGTALAQTKDYHHGHKYGGHMGLHRIEKVVELSEEQKTALKDLRHDVKADRPERTHRRLSGLDPTAPDYQQQVEAIADAAAEQARKRVLQQGEMHQRVNAILTDEQKEKLRANKQEMMEKHGRRNKMIRDQ